MCINCCKFLFDYSSWDFEVLGVFFLGWVVGIYGCVSFNFGLGGWDLLVVGVLILGLVDDIVYVLVFDRLVSYWNFEFLGCGCWVRSMYLLWL